MNILYYLQEIKLMKEFNFLVLFANNLRIAFMGLKHIEFIGYNLKMIRLELENSQYPFNTWLTL